MAFVNQPPWREQARAQFPGMPAWGRPSTLAMERPLGATRFAEVTPTWAWGGADGSGVRVCVVDTGIDDSHPLVGRLDQTKTVSGAADELMIVEAQRGGAGDPVGHGTACAGIIRSVAPGASLTSVRVLTDGMFGQGIALLFGLEWAIEEGFDVINLSLSTMKEQFQTDLHRLADYAYFRRSLIVASAHNMPVRSFPWTFASVISVASHDRPDPMLFFYNPSPPVEFYARGVRVLAPWTDGGTRRVTGNSFAAPHISGICALILSKHSWLTPTQIKCILYLTSKNVTDSSGGRP